MNTTQSHTERKRQRSHNQPLGQWIRTDKRLAIYLRDRCQCSYCGTDLQQAIGTDKVQLDHLICKDEGGGNHETNLTTACQKCNCSRQAKKLTDFTTASKVLAIQVRNAQPLLPFRTVARDIIAGNISISEGLEIVENL
jgi:5-methylcytosine-specific restriction endonuclease McrA